MNRLSILSASAVLTASFAMPVFAGSPEAQHQAAPDVVPVTRGATTLSSGDWTGAYGGLQLGYGELSEDVEADGVLYGLQAGYDWDLGDWVVGAAVDANFGDLDTDAGTLDSLSRIKLRGGYDLGDTLVYGTTGWAYGASDDLGDDWGYFAGIGVEQRLNDQMSLYGEVSQARFDDYQDVGDMKANMATIGLNFRF